MGLLAALTLVLVWPKPKWGGLIAMPDFEFYDSKEASSDDSYFTFWGAVAGEHVGYPNNHFSATCLKNGSVCHTYSLDQLGEDQIGRIDASDFNIIKWTPDYVQAENDGLCVRLTLNIDRKNEHVGYVREPINISTPACEKADTSIYKWEIGRPEFWRKLDPKDDRHKGRWAVPTI